MAVNGKILKTDWQEIRPLKSCSYCAQLIARSHSATRRSSQELVLKESVSKSSDRLAQAANDIVQAGGLALRVRHLPYGVRTVGGLGELGFGRTCIGGIVSASGERCSMT